MKGISCIRVIRRTNNEGNKGSEGGPFRLPVTEVRMELIVEVLYKAREGRGEGSGDSESCESIFCCLDFRSASKVSKGRRDINALINHLGEDSDFMCCSSRVKRGPGVHRVISGLILRRQRMCARKR